MMIVINMGFLVMLFIIMIIVNIIDSIPVEARIGHGLCSTRWNGLNLFMIILLLLCI